MQRLEGLVRRAIQEYGMLSPGDRVCVGVSGGKDSVALTIALARLQKYLGIPFELVAVSLDPQFGGKPTDYTPLAGLFAAYGVQYEVRRSGIGHVVFDLRKEPNPCALCAKMRRGLLHNTARDLGCNKVALGHHYDDAVETFFLSLFYEGRLSCFQPVTNLDRTGVIQIRPMLYLSEKTIAHFAAKERLPVVHNPCPADKNTKRQEVKDLVYELSSRYPDLKERVFGAMQRLPLPEWGPKGRYKRPRDTGER